MKWKEKGTKKKAMQVQSCATLQILQADMIVYMPVYAI